jgi:hypothetical protein
MHEYDVVFKLILQSVDLTMRELGAAPIARWLNVELPRSATRAWTCSAKLPPAT